jgi:hypothetical protein
MVTLDKNIYPILSREGVADYNSIEYLAIHLKWGKEKQIAANLEVGAYLLSLAQACSDTDGKCDRCMQALTASNVNIHAGRYHHIQCTKPDSKESRPKF